MVAALSRLPRCAPVRKVRREIRRTVFTTVVSHIECVHLSRGGRSQAEESPPANALSAQRVRESSAEDGQALFLHAVDIKTSAACWRRGGGGLTVGRILCAARRPRWVCSHLSRSDEGGFIFFSWLQERIAAFLSRPVSATKLSHRWQPRFDARWSFFPTFIFGFLRVWGRVSEPVPLCVAVPSQVLRNRTGLAAGAELIRCNIITGMSARLWYLLLSPHSQQFSPSLRFIHLVYFTAERGRYRVRARPRGAFSPPVVNERLFCAARRGNNVSCVVCNFFVAVAAVDGAPFSFWNSSG